MNHIQPAAVDVAFTSIIPSLYAEPAPQIDNRPVSVLGSSVELASDNVEPRAARKSADGTPKKTELPSDGTIEDSVRHHNSPSLSRPFHIPSEHCCHDCCRCGIDPVHRPAFFNGNRGLFHDKLNRN